MWTGMLPIGSVVLLKNSNKRLMVIGHLQQKADTKEIFDYAGCLYPEGYYNAENNYLFNHDQIDRIYNVGYMDDEEFAYSEHINDLRDKIRSGEVKFD